MNYRTMMTLRSKYNQGFRTDETKLANRLYLKLRSCGLLKGVTKRDSSDGEGR